MHINSIRKKTIYIALPITGQYERSLERSYKAMYLLRMRGLLPFAPAAHSVNFHIETCKRLGLEDSTLNSAMDYEGWDLDLLKNMYADDARFNASLFGYDTKLVIALDTLALKDFNNIMPLYDTFSFEDKLKYHREKSNWISNGCYGEVMWALSNGVQVVDLDFLMNSGVVKTII